MVAAGSRAAVPDIPGLAAVPFLTNETLFGLTERPAHLLILGCGAIGLEMAQAHRLLGSAVTVIEAGTVAAREEPELAAGLRDVLRAQGVTILEHAAVASVAPGPVLALKNGQRIAGSHLLVAAGRRPNIEDLGLDAGGVRASGRGIATDRGLRSLTNRRVYAVGDIADPEGIGPRAFTHVGSYHAGLVIRRALFRLPARVDYRALPRVTYTDPELAQVGSTEAEARAAGRSIEVLRWALREKRPRDHGGRHGRLGETRRCRRPRGRRRHPRPARGRDDRRLGTRDRAPNAARRFGRPDPALPNTRGSRQAGRRHSLRAAPVRGARQSAGAGTRAAALTAALLTLDWFGLGRATL